MDFNLTEQQLEFQQLARTFSDKELAPFAAEWDSKHFFPKDVIKKAGELGFCSLYIPANVGGLELTRLDASIILEELAMGCTSTTAFITIHNMATWMIATFGNDETKNEWCPQLVTGKKLASYCLTEATSGSDAGSLRTIAEKQGNNYCINGSKIFISGAGDTDVLVVMVRTGDAGTKGISSFLIPADADGVSYGRKEDKMGWNSQPTRAVTFENVLIPAHYRLGKEGEGFKIAMKGLDGGRINIATCSLGTAQAALNNAQRYMHERKQFGKTLANFQALQFKLADMVTELVAARQMVHLAAFHLDSKHSEATAFCAMAKRFATDMGFKICNDALQIFGGYGYIKEYPMERYVRDSRVHQILEGTNEIMRVIIARRILLEGATEVIR